MQIDSLAFVLLANHFLLAPLPAPSVNDVVERMIARNSAVQSIYIEFVRPRNELSTADPSPLQTISLSGEEFIHRRDSETIIHQSRHDASLETQGASTDDGWILHLSAPSDNLADRYLEVVDFRIIRAGLIPWTSLLDYVTKHRSGFTDSGEVCRDQVSYRRLVLSIPRSDFKALQIATAELARAPSMLLGLEIAHELGGVIGRLEYLLPDGTPTSWFEASDFREVAPGIWFPYRYVQARDYSRDGFKLELDQFVVREIRFVNEAIPKEQFSIEVPKGTKVIDSREGAEVEFDSLTSVTLNELDSQISATKNPPRAFQRWNSIVIWVNLVLLVAIAAVFQWRSRIRPLD